MKQVLTAENGVKFATGAISLYAADAFYHFGSFSRECVAFGATWFALWVVGSMLLKLAARKLAPQEN